MAASAPAAPAAAGATTPAAAPAATPAAAGATTPAAAPAPHSGLKKTLSWVDLTLVGVGGIVGAGIYVLTGQAAARYAGPAISLSFAIAAVTCSFAALCYSELSALLPIPGSAYTFASATLGELVGWCIGWDLMLEYLMGAATVAVGWSGYFCSLCADLAGAPLPLALTRAPYARAEHGEAWVATGGVVNLPAVAVVLAMTALQVRGVQESALFNNIVVGVKVAVLLLFLAVGWGYTRSENWVPFIPPAQGSDFGAWGVLKGSSVVFFSACVCARLRAPARGRPPSPSLFTPTLPPPPSLPPNPSPRRLHWL
jgi:APA family basic amino acid/polyamine antiporter